MTAGGQMSSTLPFDDHVAAWRANFPVTELWIYLNHAAVRAYLAPGTQGDDVAPR